MSEEQTRDGSSVDDSEAGQQNTGHLMMMSLDSDQSQMNKVDDGKKQQTDGLLCQNSEIQPVKVREDDDQPTSSNQAGAEAPPEPVGLQADTHQPLMGLRNQTRMQVDVNQENEQRVPNNQQMVLWELKKEMSELQISSVDEKHLADCIKKTSNDPGNLLQLFQLLNKEQKKSSKAASSSWFKATVKVFSVVTGETCGADRVILKKMNKSLTMDLTTDWQECDIIIVFCPIISRVGSDVNAAMRKITDLVKPVILVLMHHTRDIDYSTDIKKWSESLEEVVLDVHVFFHETLQGLLKCRRNDRAVNQIEEVLKKHSKYGFSRSWR